MQPPDHLALEEDGTVAPFRYKVKSRPLVSCFEPRPLADSLLAAGQVVRASMFGARYLVPAPPAGQQPDPNLVAKFGLGKLPNSDQCAVLWEAWLSFFFWLAMKLLIWLFHIDLQQCCAFKFGFAGVGGAYEHYVSEAKVLADRNNTD